MGKGSAPSAPDPYASAAAQYQFGTAAGNYNMGLNAVNRVSPYGSTTWTENPAGMPGAQGTAATPSGGASSPNTPYAIDFGNGGLSILPGAAYGTGAGIGNTPPQYTETTTLSPVEQQIFNTQTANQLGQGQTAQELLPQAQDAAARAGQIGADSGQRYNAGFNTAMAGERAALDPVWSQNREQMDASLRNSGATPGTPAYDNAMAKFNSQEAGAYTQAAGQAEGQGLNLESTLFGQDIQGQELPINEFLALSGGGGGATNPMQQAGGGGGSTPSATVSTPDLMAAFQNQYQGQLAGYNANVASSNATMGDLSMLAAAAIMYY